MVKVPALDSTIHVGESSRTDPPGPHVHTALTCLLYPAESPL